MPPPVSGGGIPISPDPREYTVTTVHIDRHTEAMSEHEISMREGRAAFGDLVSRAEYSGEITYVTRHGRRVAAIVPLDRITAPSSGARKADEPPTNQHTQ